MKRLEFKDRFKLCKGINGKYSPMTMYYAILKNPVFILLYPFMMFFSFVLAIPHYLIELFYLVCKFIKYHLLVATKGKYEVNNLIKPIAFYLPQFHEIEENNRWWGQGFTEWTNVKKAVPLFDDHYQPHIPHKDIGYYDLSDVNVMKKQAKIAKDFGLYGFCFYYYHFADGKRLLEKPINNWLKAKDINFPFCFAWANENWTRTWDGGDKDVIMPQDYDRENMLSMLREMLPAFKDERYIKIDNKPVLLVYRAEIIPDIKNIAQLWRKTAKENGFDDLYLISVQNFRQENPFNMGFDAAVEFAPQISGKTFCWPMINIEKFQNIQKPTIGRYENVIDTHLNFGRVSYPRYKCVCPAWDNSPRRGNRSPRLLIGSTPQLFGKFYKKAAIVTLENPKTKDNGLLFINAWNEWGEGAHLEPDEKYGYAWLEEIKKVQNMKIKDLGKKGLK